MRPGRAHVSWAPLHSSRANKSSVRLYCLTHPPFAPSLLIVWRHFCFWGRYIELASSAGDDCPPYLLLRPRVSWLLAPSGLPLHRHAPHVAQSFIQAFLGRSANRRRRDPAAVLSLPRPALLSNVSARLCYVYARSHSPRLQKQWASVASPPSVCTCCLTQSGPVLSVSYTSESIRRPSGSYNISCLFPLPPFHYLLSCSAGPPLGYLV